MQLQTLKGFRDFLPSSARKRQFVIEKLKQVFEKYGFEPLETPALEYEELLAGKYGEEGEKLMYRFEDRGGRRVALRYDQTVPLARVVTQYQNDLPLPFKRYQVQPVWRAENTQKGRYREFLQCDADILGISSEIADAELLAVAADGLKNIGFKDFTILVNDRKIFTRLVEKGLITEDQLIPTVAAIDKLKKIGREGVITELTQKGIIGDAALRVLETIENERATDYILKIHSLLEAMGQDPKHFVFDPSLARGLDYYTDLIFEIEINGISGSVCGGGRYNKLVGQLSGVDIPAAGFAYGFDRLMEAAEELGIFPKELEDSATKILITIFDESTTMYSLTIAYHLWQNGINAQIYEDEKAKLDKQLKYANRKKIPQVILAGPEEMSQNTLTLKNLETGEQKTFPLSSLTQEIT